MERTPLRLISAPIVQRSRLTTLEKIGMVQEAGDCGGSYRPSTTLDHFPSSGDPGEDQRLRDYMLKKQRESEQSRERRLARLRRLARMDFRMVGGVTPIGFFGGSGGGETGSFRASSNSARF